VGGRSVENVLRGNSAQAQRLPYYQADEKGGGERVRSWLNRPGGGGGGPARGRSGPVRRRQNTGYRRVMVSAGQQKKKPNFRDKHLAGVRAKKKSQLRGRVQIASAIFLCRTS